MNEAHTGTGADPESSASTSAEGRGRSPRSRGVIDTVGGTLAGLRATVARQFAVDTRALAALRIALGGLLLTDLVLRSRFLVFFYTDAGVLPRTALRAARPTVSALSLHALWGGPTAQAALFLLAAVAALALAAGYHVRVATVVSWLLLVSLHARNPIVLSGGDVLLRRTLFWGLFLPLGARWSLDSAAGRGTRWWDAERDDGDDGASTRLAGPATAALLVQPVLVYGTNAVIKLRGTAWPSGRAIRFVFGLDRYTLPTGDVLAETAGPALSVLGWTWLALLVAAPLLVVLRGRARSALVAGFAAGHLGMLATMRLGLFPLISVAALLPYLHTGFWDRLAATRPVAWLEDRLARRDAGREWDPAVARTGRPRSWLRGAVPAPVSRRSARRLARVAVVALLVGVGVWNAVALGYVPVDTATATPPADLPWDMFAPAPPDSREWVVAPGRTTGGERVDAYGGTRLSPDASRWDRPSTAHGVRWRKYTISLVWGEEPRLVRPFAAGLCARWNRTHASGLDNVTVYAVREPVRLDGRPGERERRRLVSHDCRTGFPPAGVGVSGDRG